MANSLTTCTSVLIRNISSKSAYLSTHLTTARFLYSEAALGVDNYVKTRERIGAQLVNMADKFKEKMVEYVEPKAANMIFTEDLKNMVHIAEADAADLNLVCNMMLRFNKQNNNLRFGSFVFGPVVMRMYHHLNKPDEALACFKNPELTGFFDQLMSYQILMDLLYQNKRYDDVLEVFEIIKAKQIQSAKYPKHVIVMALAALYKQNTKESFQFAMDLWKELQLVGHQPMRRASSFMAGLAIQQGAPDVALEIISTVRNQSYMTIRNLRTIALAALNRPDDALAILKGVVDIDLPIQQKFTVNREVIEAVKVAIEKTANKDLIVQFERVHKHLEDNGNITENTLEEDLCLEIQGTLANRDGRYQNSNRGGNQYQMEGGNQYQNDRRNRNYQGQGRRNSFPQRPGLNELY